MTTPHALDAPTTSPGDGDGDGDGDSIWRGRLGRTSLGLFSLAFLVAFESLAVVSVMPEVARALDGLALYAVAFAAPVAVSIFSRTASASWIERAGPAPALGWGVAVFAAGLVVCGTATSMSGFLLGRAVQGLGAGPIGVALWVVVAQAYPDRLRPRALAVMTSAWTVPAIVGPVVAGGLTHAFGWRVVFLLGPVLAAASLAVAWPAVRSLTGSPSTEAGPPRGQAAGGLAAAAVAAAAVLLVSVAGQRTLPAWPAWLVLGLVGLALSVRRLVPRRTWSGGRGLPSLIGSRAFFMASYFAAEVYVPLVLVDQRGLSVGLAGAAISGTAFTWYAGAAFVSRPERLPAPIGTPRRRALLGAGAILLGLLAVPLSLAAAVPVVVVATVWVVGGFGMGVLSSTSVTEVLRRSGPGQEAGHSAALQTSDSVAESVALALGGTVFAAAVVHGLGVGVLAAFAVPTACVVAGLLVLGRGYER
ncbi:MFS family permease [Aeromicrobium sp. SORGH_AS981]|uniref:MFS transporter n=1 Tax=Aeromicrobium sp. SORGH_AS_0981 TaxID=3041802 RepID=UPI00285AFB91|nr:MFS transporter [Aeromicrobium sp. SORGH_AS_0981]MDR6119996.1 MFS family permease [Aeromicrobium sp. SORGH_AS_0981]